MFAVARAHCLRLRDASNHLGVSQEAYRFSTSPLPLHRSHRCKARPPTAERRPLPLQAGQRSILGGFVSQPIFTPFREIRSRRIGGRWTRSSGCGSQGGRMAPMSKAHCMGITPITTTLVNQITAPRPWLLCGSRGFLSTCRP